MRTGDDNDDDHDDDNVTFFVQHSGYPELRELRDKPKQALLAGHCSCQ